MLEHQFPLFVQRRVGRNRLAAQRRLHLAEQPGLAERRPGDHHAVDRVAAKRLDHRLRAKSRSPLPISGIRFRCGLISAIRSQSAEPLKKSCGRAAVDRQGRGPGRFDHLGHFDGVDRVARAAQADLGRHRRRRAGRDHALDDRAIALGIAQQIRAAMGFLRDRLHRAAEIDVDHADAEFVGQLGPDGGQRFRIVVPDLHGQRPRLLRHAPQPVGKFVLVLLDPQKALGVDHLGGLQADAAELAHDLPKGIVGEAGHRRLQHRRIDHQRPDLKGSDPRGQIEVGGCFARCHAAVSRARKRLFSPSPRGGTSRVCPPDAARAAQAFQTAGHRRDAIKVDRPTSRRAAARPVRR